MAPEWTYERSGVSEEPTAQLLAPGRWLICELELVRGQKVIIS